MFRSYSFITLSALVLAFAACSPKAVNSNIATTTPQTPENTPIPKSVPRSVRSESVTAEGLCTQSFLDSYNSVAAAQNELAEASLERSFPDFSKALNACSEFESKHHDINCRAVDTATGRDTTIESSKVIQSCDEIEERSRLIHSLTASDRVPVEKRANTLRLKISNDLLFNDMLDGSGSPVDTGEGVSCILKRDNPTGKPVEIAEVYRIRMAIQFPMGDKISSYLWLDSNALVIECLKPGREPITVLDLKKALSEQAEIRILPDSL